MQRFYYGWRIVGMGAIVYMVVSGVIYSSYGLYVIPVSQDLGLSRTDMNMGLILLNLGNAALAPFVGRALDRLPARRIMLVGALFSGLSLLALGLSRSLWLSALIMVTILPLATLTAGTMTMPVLMARWFTAQRGRAMTIASMGFFLGSIVVLPLVALLLEIYGWRMTLIGIGGGLAGLLFLLTLMVRERPAPGEGEGGATPVPVAADMPAAQPERVMTLLRMPMLWAIGISAAITMGISQAIMVTIVPLGREAGLSAMQAASLMSVSGGSALATTLLLAAIADRFDRALLLTILFLLCGAAIGVLLLTHSYPLLLLSSVLTGLAMGGVPPMFYAILADRFGAVSFGTVRGICIPMGAAAGMAAVLFVGYVYDSSGGYGLAITVFLAAQLAAAALMYMARLRRPAVGILQPETSA